MKFLPRKPQDDMIEVFEVYYPETGERMLLDKDPRNLKPGEAITIISDSQRLGPPIRLTL